MQMHEAWLKKASSDLLISKRLFSLNEEELLDGVVYHTQQCAEKSFKAYLSFKKHSLEKTHNLVLLTKLCSTYDDEFNSLLKLAAILNPYSVKFRYPDDIMLPDVEDVKEAILFSENIFKFVQKKIDEFIVGQASIFKKS